MIATLPSASIQRWRKSFVGNLSNIATATEWVQLLAVEQGLADNTVFALQLCLEELMSNTVRHGGKGGWSPDDRAETTVGCRIDIELAIDDRNVFLTIEDDAMPFDVAAVSGSVIDKPLRAVDPGGLGIGLVKNFASHLSYERAGLGNRVIVEFLR